MAGIVHADAPLLVHVPSVRPPTSRRHEPHLPAVRDPAHRVVRRDGELWAAWTDNMPLHDLIAEGDRVAVRGNFLIDSQFQIRGLPSLFYQEGQAPAGHHHGGEPQGAPAPQGVPGDRSPPPPEHKH